MHGEIFEKKQLIVGTEREKERNKKKYWET
jgi:hypothetical protein